MSRTNHARGNARPDPVKELTHKPIIGVRESVNEQGDHHDAYVANKRPKPIIQYQYGSEVIDFDALADWEIELLGRADSVYASQQEAVDAVNGGTNPLNTKGTKMTRTPKVTIEFVGMNAATLAQILLERNRNRQGMASSRDINAARKNAKGMTYTS